MRRLPRQIASQSNGGSRLIISTVCKKYSNTGQFGVQFTTEELFRSVFKDPMMVRPLSYAIKIIPKDITQPFIYVQILSKLDAKDSNPLVVLTTTRRVTNNGTALTCRIAGERSFWVMDKDDSFTILDVQLNSILGNAEGIVSVTTRARIEIDDMTIL